MMRLNVHERGLRTFTPAASTKWLRRREGHGFLYVRDEVIDRPVEHHRHTRLASRRFGGGASAHGSSNVPALIGMRSARLQLGIRSGMSGSNTAPPANGGWMPLLQREDVQRGAESWTSPRIPALRCAICLGKPLRRVQIYELRNGVEDEEDPHPRRRTFEIRLSEALLSAAPRTWTRFLAAYEAIRPARTKACLSAVAPQSWHCDWQSQAYRSCPMRCAAQGSGTSTINSEPAVKQLSACSAFAGNVSKETAPR